MTTIAVQSPDSSDAVVLPPLTGPAAGVEDRQNSLAGRISAQDDDDRFVKQLSSDVDDDEAAMLFKKFKAANPEFANLEKDDDANMLARVFAVIKVKDGEKIMTANEPASFVALILEGNVNVHLGSNILAALATGTVLGEMAFFEGGQRTADVTTQSDAVLAVISYRELEDLKKHNITLAWALMQVIARTSIAKLRAMETTRKEEAGPSQKTAKGSRLSVSAADSGEQESLYRTRIVTQRKMKRNTIVSIPENGSIAKDLRMRISNMKQELLDLQESAAKSAQESALLRDRLKQNSQLLNQQNSNFSKDNHEREAKLHELAAKLKTLTQAKKSAEDQVQSLLDRIAASSNQRAKAVHQEVESSNGDLADMTADQIEIRELKGKLQNLEDQLTLEEAWKQNAIVEVETWKIERGRLEQKMGTGVRERLKLRIDLGKIQTILLHLAAANFKSHYVNRKNLINAHSEVTNIIVSAIRETKGKTMLMVDVPPVRDAQDLEELVASTEKKVSALRAHKVSVKECLVSMLEHIEILKTFVNDILAQTRHWQETAEAHYSRTVVLESNEAALKRQLLKVQARLDRSTGRLTHLQQKEQRMFLLLEGGAAEGGEKTGEPGKAKDTLQSSEEAKEVVAVLADRARTLRENVRELEVRCNTLEMQRERQLKALRKQDLSNGDGFMSARKARDYPHRWASKTHAPPRSSRKGRKLLPYVHTRVQTTPVAPKKLNTNGVVVPAIKIPSPPDHPRSKGVTA